jgi:hypothetical protein
MPSIFDTLPQGVSVLRLSWGDAGRIYGAQEAQALANVANGIAETIKRTSNIGTLGGRMTQDDKGNFHAFLAVQKP